MERRINCHFPKHVLSFSWASWSNYLVPLGHAVSSQCGLTFCPHHFNLRFRLLALTPFDNKCMFWTPISYVKYHKLNNLNKAHLFFLFFCRGHFNCLFIFTSLTNSELHSLFLFHGVLLQHNRSSRVSLWFLVSKLELLGPQPTSVFPHAETLLV